MALMKCPECSNEISDRAESCPHCGFPITKFLEKKKAEQLVQEAFAAETMRKEEQKKKLDRSTASTPNYSEDESPSKPNFKLMAVVVSAIFLLAICGYYSNANDVKAKEQQKITQKRTWFNSAKQLIKSNELRDDELDKAKGSLASIDASMPEYKEAQELLSNVDMRILTVKKEKEVKAAKERKATEDAQYTPGGKRVHAKHPEWDSNDCNAIARGHIGIGMTSAQVAAAWGRPYHINKTHNSYGSSEQWVMSDGLPSSYVYFENGVCTTIQN
ncbi:MAG: zinc ribbon domain-containing protein [Desulfuromonadaceae bacterium]|nr:zinc ribbon domain-containing protein [Desulfuromonadaceae bacterium]